MDCPTSFQLEKVFNRYFYTFSTEAKCEELSEECNRCVSLRKFPKEIDSCNTKLVPEHPGSHFNADVMVRAAQRVLVCMDMFSGYVVATFINSEKKDDMVEAIIQLTTPIRHAPYIHIRTDKATSLQSLAKTQHQDFIDNGIEIILGDDMNKNSNCQIDKKIQELESEIRKFSPQETPITIATLARAITNLNSRIRNQGLTASQVQFSRDFVTGENLTIDDKRIMTDKLEKRKSNQQSSAKSKAQVARDVSKVNAVQGEIVYIKDDISKHKARDPYIVTEVTDGKVNIQKILHSSQAAKAGPSLSSKVNKVDPKFLFKVKKPEDHHNVQRPGIYVIPQKRKSSRIQNRQTPNFWISKQSADLDSEEEATNDTIEDVEGASWRGNVINNVLMNDTIDESDE